MTKADLIDRVYRDLEGDVPVRKVRMVVEALFEVMKRSIKKNKHFTLTGFGALKFFKQPACIARNPRTGERVEVGRRRTVRFVVSPTYKRSLNPRRFDS